MASEHEIEITERTVLRIGGFRITIEPEPAPEPALARVSPAKLKIGSPTPREWRVAEAELQQRSRSPFETDDNPNVERFSFVPRPGGMFRLVGGAQAEIAHVAGRDGSLWFVLDPKGRPFAVRRIDLHWQALPPNPTPPARGETIVHASAESTIAEVVGGAEVGGWLVTNNAGVSLHVVRSEHGRWMSLGMAEVGA